MRIVSPTGHRIIPDDERAMRFGPIPEPRYPHRLADSTRLYEGDLNVKGDLAAMDGRRGGPDNVIVDGDLTVAGVLDWWDPKTEKFLLVTGNLRAGGISLGERVHVMVRGDLRVDGPVEARSFGEGPLDGDTRLAVRNLWAAGLTLVGHVDVTVSGDLTVANGIVARGVDDRGSLTVAGRTQAPIIIGTRYFTMDFADQPSADVIIGAPPQLGCGVHFDEHQLPDIVAPELLDGAFGGGDEGGGEIHDEDFERIEEAVATGLAVLRPDARPGRLLGLEWREVLTRPHDQIDNVTDLDLSDRNLRRLPEEVRSFPHLRRLNLAHNHRLDRLPEWIGELAHLEELDLSGTRLSRLPASFACLSRLRFLDVSTHEGMPVLPAQIGGLTRLRALTARKVRDLGESLTGLEQLEELDVWGLGDGHYGRVAFPRVVTRLPRLRVLRLGHTHLSSVPDDLLAMTSLVELDLNSSLPSVRRLPRLSRLPELQILRVNGSSGDSSTRPSPHLLDVVWDITTLEELDLSFWGAAGRTDSRSDAREAPRPALALPEDAFARMPRLRRLDLRHSGVTTLPESFYRLTELDDVRVDFAELDGPTRRRLAALVRTEPDNPAHDWIRAVQVHLLLKAGRTEDAHAAAHRVLTRRPGFPALADVAASARFQSWHRRGSAPSSSRCR